MFSANLDEPPRPGHDGWPEVPMSRVTAGLTSRDPGPGTPECGSMTLEDARRDAERPGGGQWLASSWRTTTRTHSTSP
jgi:hypothetical protein